MEGHLYRLGEGDDAALEELVVVGGEGIGDELLADVAIGGFVEIGARRLEACEKGQASGAIAAFFAKLALRRLCRLFSGLASAARDLP